MAIVILYFCFFSSLDTLGLVGPDEPRYAGVAREMAESGDWVTPRLNGKPWFEKPILYYWSAAAAFRAFGVNEFATRLPSALAAILMTLAMAWTASRFYGAETGRLVMLLLPTTVAAIAFARAATTDMLFSAALSFAMAAGAGVIWEGQPEKLQERAQPEVRPQTNRWRSVGFGIWLGVAALAKGPAAIVLAGGSVALWALGTRRWREAFRLAHPVAVAAFGVVALPWYLVCAARNPEFVDTFLISHNLERFLTPVFRHEQPFWFFGPILLLGLVPWITLLAAPLGDATRAVRDKQWASAPGFFLACWVIFPLAFFSVSKSKLPGYVLPVVPPLVLLIAASVARAIEEKASRLRWMMAGVGATWLVLAASPAPWLKKLPAGALAGSEDVVGAWCSVVAVAGAAIAILGWLRRTWMALAVSALLMAGLVEGANRELLPQLDAHLSPRAAALILPEKGAETVRVFRMHRAWHYGLNFYLGREIAEWKSPADGPGLVYTSEAGLAELARMGVEVETLQRVSRQAVLVRVGAKKKLPG